MKDLEIAVLKTLAYADMFEQGLSVEELWRFLIDVEVSESELETSLGEFRVSSFEFRNGVACLKGRGELLRVKSQQLQTANRKLQTARRYVWLFRLVPWVKLVAVTGSVGGGSPREDDDIDLVVVTSKDRLWLSRLVCTGVFSFIGKRRKPTDDPDNVNDKICLNMWLSEERLASEHEDVYVASELAHMVPILNRDGMYERYIQTNGWVKKVLPNFFNSVQRPASSVQQFRNKPGMTPLTTHHSPLTFLDAKLEQWQLKRMRPRTKETVEDGLLMFHPKDYRTEILERYEEKLKELNIK